MSVAFDNKDQLKPDVISLHQAMLPKKHVGVQACSVWATSLLFVFFQFFIQLSSGQIVNGLMKSFELTALGAGFLSSAYYYVYVSLQTPAGILIDRYRPRLLLSLGALVLMGGCVLFAAAHSFWLAFFARMIMGFGASFAFVGTMYLTDKWFPRKHFAMLTGMVELMGMVGTLIGVHELAYYVDRFGWRECFMFAGYIAGAIAILVALIVRNMPANRVSLSAKPIKRRVLPGLRVLIRMRVAWINAIFSGIMFMLVTVFASLWAIPYVELSHNYTLLEATFFCSMVYVGVGLCSPFIGWLDARVKHRRYLMSGLALLGFANMLVIILVPTLPAPALAICMFLVGVSCSSYILTFAVANQISATRIRTASIGFVNTFSVGSSPIFQPLIGFILYLLARHDHPFEMKQYTVPEFQMALLIIPVCLAIAAWLAWFIPSRKS